MQKRWVSGVLVVHITLGVSALVCALFLGKRLGYPKEAMPPHSVVLSVIAACLLWVGLASMPEALFQPAAWRPVLL